MYPTNHYMDPYSSYYRHHAPYPYYPPPGWEVRPQKMPEVDSSCPPPSGTWPYSGGMNHSGIPESHSCCSHTYPHGYHYSFRPPFSQELPPPHYPYYYHVPFPPHHPNPYSSSCFGPLPPYPVDQTPYNAYDEKFKSHCCGCPNHVCHGDGGQKSNVKIEEHMPEVKPEGNQKGADNNSSIIRNPNYQYPVMWLPSGDMKDKGNGRSVEFPPQLFSKWFPRSGERTEDVKPSNDNQKAAKQLQWPMVWMPPGYDETKQQAKKELKEIEQSPKNTQEDPPSPKIKIIPLSWFGNDSHDQKPAANDGSGEQNGRSSVANPAAGTEHRHDTTGDANCKTIPVVAEKPTNGNAHAISVLPEKPKSGNEPAISVVPEKHDLEKKVRTCRTIPVMPQKDSGEKKSYKDVNKEEKKASMVQKEGENKKSNNVESSKAKPSKLPPVCLRVDPLPKKKSGNTSSRSSSPATKNVCEKGKDVKEAQGKNQETKLSEHQKEGNVPVKEKSSDEIPKNAGPRNVTVLDASVKHAQEEQVSTSVTDQKVQPTVSAEAQENVSARSLHECDKNRKEDELKIQGEAPNLTCEIKLSEPDAAVCIQSAYRGYHVRRWQPLEKLRKIKKVHKQMQEVEKQIQALEASSDQPTEKEHVAINETIMNLLLNLDTIQNLHPVVREARKSVARQLVCLQEKLDALCKKLPAEPTNHRKSGEEQLPSSVNSKEPMRDDVSSEVSLKLGQDGDSNEQKHQMEESRSTKEAASTDSNEQKHQMEESRSTKEAASMDVMRDAALSGLITEKKHQMEEPDILREECTEQEKAPAMGELSSTDYTEPLQYSTPVSDGSALKQCTPSAEQNCHTEESDHGVSPATTEDDAAAMATACTESEVGVCKQDGSVQGGDQVQEESATVDSSWPKHDAAPAEDQCKEASAKFLHMEDSAVSSEGADAHGNDPALADDSVGANPGAQQEESVNADMQKEEAVTTLVAGKEPDGTPTPRVGDTGTMDDCTDANSVTVEQENFVLVESEARKQCEVSGKDDSTLVDQQSELQAEDPVGGSAIGEEPEAAVSLDVDDKTMINTSLNDATGEEPEAAVPLKTEGKTMEITSLNDAAGEEPEAAVPLETEGKTMENTSLNDAIGEETAAAESRVETIEDTVMNDAVGEEPEAVPVKSRVETMETTLTDHSTMPVETTLTDHATMPVETTLTDHATMPAGIVACATAANSAAPVPEAGKPEEGSEGAPPEEEEKEEATATASARHDNGGDDDRNTGVTDEKEQLKEMVQKLLASGNEQMGVIAELGDKVKSLERKLAVHKRRRPKVRVQHRPARANDVH
ncbi:uncharacterized protein LOC123450059 isoform X3 [Hordeum vulgare subsp. vulgare]|uniref:uncharacterized protein LOC123450059 isoform X3 n=1 Tax=Hordeum vulgare subsp. vulgare TaxID=112509 RepID=UPI000B4627E3|nr:uncharacterized protein LOC123450059 isoform X3 [Hordeum vulgare subsp. vulgare]